MKLLSSESFKESVLSSSGVVLVVFSADNCRPCKDFEPTLKDVEDQNPTVTLFQVKKEESKDLFQELEVQSTPTIILFENGERKRKTVGRKSYDDVLNFIAGTLEEKKPVPLVSRQVDIKKLEIVGLKALAYDEFVKLESANKNLQLINQEILSRR